VGKYPVSESHILYDKSRRKFNTMYYIHKNEILLEFTHMSNLDILGKYSFSISLGISSVKSFQIAIIII